MRAPMTMEDYHNSRYIVEPFHLYDCCLVSNGAVAVIITSAERARSLKQPPVYVLGMGQGAPGDDQRTDREPGIYTGAFTPLSEGIVQASGQGSERQVEKNDLLLISGNGGVLNYHSTTILSKRQS